MSQLIESIKILDGRVYNLHFHENRANMSRMSLFGIQDPLNIKKVLSKLQIPKKGLLKCRIIYDQEISEVEIKPYSIRKIEKIKIIYDDHVSYQYKLLDRKELDLLYAQREVNDEILIVKNGLLADAYYYNIVCKLGSTYYTPSIPLLQGIQREYLLSKTTIIEEEISAEDILKFDMIYLINALTPLLTIGISPKSIIV